jgi:hypothetical protein
MKRERPGFACRWVAFGTVPKFAVRRHCFASVRYENQDGRGAPRPYRIRFVRRFEQQPKLLAANLTDQRSGPWVPKGTLDFGSCHTAGDRDPRLKFASPNNQGLPSRTEWQRHP